MMALSIVNKCDSIRSRSHLLRMKRYRFFLRAKFGIQTRLNRDKDRCRLRVVDASIKRLRDLVGPYLIPSMLYKLPL